MIREPQSSTGNTMIGIFQSSVAGVQGVSVPGGTLNLLSVLGKTLVEVSVNK